MPGPIAACARSTGAILPCCNSRRAGASSFLSVDRNSRREAEGAFSGRGRQTSTIEDARAFVPLPTFLVFISERIGQVPVITKPAFTMPSNIVSQPVDAVEVD